MPWFKVDDAFAVHPKTIKAGNKALGLWVRAGSWCAQQLTDGRVPAYVLPMLGGDAADAEALIAVRLWDATEDGYEFRGWLDFQPSREAIEAERAATRERQRRAREAAKAKRNGVSHAVSHGDVTPLVTDESRRESRSPHPIPSHPDHKEGAADAAGDFDAFWAAYPKKVGKGQAAKAYRAAVKKADPAHILASLEAQLVWFAAQVKPDGDFRPQASTWLNGERWADELSAVRPKPVAGDQWSRALVVGVDV